MATTMRQNGYVTWKNLISVVGITVTLAIAFNTAIWMMHAREQLQFEKRVMEKMDFQYQNVKDELREIKTRLPR